MTDLFTEIHEEELQTFRAKGKDYDGSGPQFGNFERVAKLWDMYDLPAPTTRDLNALHNALKHLDAILMFYAGRTLLSTEGITHRLRDFRVYFKIMEVFRLQNGEGRPQSGDVVETNIPPDDKDIATWTTKYAGSTLWQDYVKSMPTSNYNRGERKKDDPII